MKIRNISDIKVVFIVIKGINLFLFFLQFRNNSVYFNKNISMRRFKYLMLLETSSISVNKTKFVCTNNNRVSYTLKKHEKVKGEINQYQL